MIYCVDLGNMQLSVNADYAEIDDAGRLLFYCVHGDARCCNGFSEWKSFIEIPDAADVSFPFFAPTP